MGSTLFFSFPTSLISSKEIAQIISVFDNFLLSEFIQHNFLLFIVVCTLRLSFRYILKISPQNSYIEFLNPSTSKCNCIADGAFKEMNLLKWGFETHVLIRGRHLDSRKDPRDASHGRGHVMIQRIGEWKSVN